nr:hypothetical protein [Candidatus Eremiobacteraeota bacterium]
MTRAARRASAIGVALSFAVCSVPVPAWAQQDDTARALALLAKGCGTSVADARDQGSAVAAAATSAPTATP